MVVFVDKRHAVCEAKKNGDTQYARSKYIGQYAVRKGRGVTLIHKFYRLTLDISFWQDEKHRIHLYT